MVRTIYPSPVGVLTLVGEGEALTGLWMENNLPKELPPMGHAPVFDRAATWLDRYFQGRPQKVDFDLKPTGTPFQKKVWQMLMTVPYGQTRTYGSIAKDLSDRMSSQAVGGAVGRNPISIIIPCHRIIGSNGKLIGYAGGLQAKEWLLRHEGGAL